jgi:hypothetical protein
MKTKTKTDFLLLFMGFCAGVIITMFLINHYKLNPYKEKQRRVAAVNNVITNASFLCGMWKVESKTFDKDERLLHMTLSALGRSEKVLMIPLDLDPELRRAWNKKRKGMTVEIIIASHRIEKYIEKGGPPPRPIDLVEPDSINDIH